MILFIITSVLLLVSGFMFGLFVQRKNLDFIAILYFVLCTTFMVVAWGLLIGPHKFETDQPLQYKEKIVQINSATPDTTYIYQINLMNTQKILHISTK